MKRIVSFFIIMLLLLSFYNVKADDTCAKEELERLKEIAQKVEINYEYDLKEVNQNGKITKYPEISLIATNLNDDLKVTISNDGREFSKGDGITTSKLTGFKQGDRIVVVIKAFVPNRCSGKTVLSKSIKLPYYNSYSETEICKNYPDMKYCSEYTDTIIKETDFYKEYNEYMEEVYNQNSNLQEEEKNNWTIVIIIGSIIVGLAIIVLISMIITNRRKKNEL